MSADGTKSTLQSWIEEEQQILQAMQHGRRAGTITRETVGKMTGMEIMRAVRCGDLPNGPMAKTLNYMIIEVEPGRAVVQGNPTQDVLNVQGSVHGGWFSTIMDAALGNAIHTMLPAGKGYGTLDLSVKMTRAIFPDVGRVRAIANVIQVGRTVATAEGRLIGPDGKLHAYATTTAMIVDMRSA